MIASDYEGSAYVAIVKAKNPELFRRWIAYYRLVEGKPANDILTPVERTQAFFNSEDGLAPPRYI